MAEFIRGRKPSRDGRVGVGRAAENSRPKSSCGTGDNPASSHRDGPNESSGPGTWNDDSDDEHARNTSRRRQRSLEYTRRSDRSGHPSPYPCRNARYKRYSRSASPLRGSNTSHRKSRSASRRSRSESPYARKTKRRRAVSPSPSPYRHSRAPRRQHHRSKSGGSQGRRSTRSLSFESTSRSLDRYRSLSRRKESSYSRDSSRDNRRYTDTDTDRSVSQEKYRRREEDDRSPHREPSSLGRYPSRSRSPLPARRLRSRSRSRQFFADDPDSRYAVVENLGNGQTRTIFLPYNYERIPRKIEGDLRYTLQRGNIIGVRHVEFASNPAWAFGKSFGISSAGPTSIKHFRPCIVRDVYYEYAICWLCRCHDEQGLLARHVREEEYYLWLGISNTGDGEGNNSPHQQMRAIQTADDYPIKPSSHVNAIELVKVRLSEDYRSYGNVENTSLWRLDALRKTCNDLDTATLAEHLQELGLDTTALSEAKALLHPQPSGYVFPSRPLSSAR